VPLYDGADGGTYGDPYGDDGGGWLVGAAGGRVLWYDGVPPLYGAWFTADGTALPLYDGRVAALKGVGFPTGVTAFWYDP
jgi:hypothetical protein